VNSSCWFRGENMRTILAFALLAVAVTAGCGSGSSSSTSPGQISIAGNWQFTVASVHGGTANGTGTLTQSGATFSGTLALTSATGPVCAASATISGTISGTNFTASLDENGQAVGLTGTVASDGSSVSGTYTAPAGGCTNGDTGTFSGTRTSVGGAFAGQLNAADRMPIGLSLNLRDEGGAVSGSAFFTHSACFASLKVAGQVEGSQIELRGVSPGGSLVLRGTADGSAKALHLHSTVTGNCQSESGSGTLTKLP
jgi:hypothetical protein